MNDQCPMKDKNKNNHFLIDVLISNYRNMTLEEIWVNYDPSMCIA